jgi:tetratricopeptide (TPR) repeat protein
VAAVVAAASVSVGCRKDDPTPKNVTNEQRTKDPDKKADTPFFDPDKEPPGPRSGDLPPPEEVAKLLGNARTQVAQGRPATAITFLRRCANKIPASVACEAELGILFTERGSARAHGRYYLAEAANVDDPSVDADTYRRVARTAEKAAQYETAAAAWGVVVGRERATAEDFFAYAQALQADPARRGEAVDALTRVYELDPTHYEAVRDRGILQAQLGDREGALASFREYVGKVGNHSPHRASIEQRIAELEHDLAHPKNRGKNKPKKKPKKK